MSSSVKSASRLQLPLTPTLRQGATAHFPEGKVEANIV
jgi:hypothetical protein